MDKYICTICSYVFDPAKGEPLMATPPGTRFEALSAEWRCPMCGAEQFEFTPFE